MKTARISVAFVVWLGAASSGLPCDFCPSERGPTLVGDFAQAAMVLYGRVGSQKLEPGRKPATEFFIEQVFKPHEIIKDKNTILVPRNFLATKSRFLLFCDVDKGTIDPYRPIEVQPASDMAKYIAGALKVKDGSPAERLRHCFDYLNSPEFEIAIDAYREFARADYKDYMGMARKLPPETIAGWLRDAKTPPFRHGLYASLLGHCGSAEHAKLLRAMIDDPEKRASSSIDGLLAGYVMLQPRAGWALVHDVLKDGKQGFLLRYAGLKTARFLWDQRPDLVERNDLVAGFALVLDQPDMADFGIDDLRKYRRWEMTDRVLELFGRKSHDILAVKRAILRFALQADNPRAATFVRQQRERDREWVADTEELLKLESGVK